MTALDLITKDDLEKFKAELFEELQKLGIGTANQLPEKQWLKSADVRRLLNISAGTLQNLRINGTIAYTKIGSLIFYKNRDILKLLEGEK